MKNRDSPKPLLLTLSYNKAMNLWTSLEPDWTKKSSGHDIWFETGSVKRGDVLFSWDEMHYAPPGVYTPTSPKPEDVDPGYDEPTLSTFFP